MLCKKENQLIEKGMLWWENLMKEITSTRETKAAIIMAKASPASKEGAPHWKGYGILILQTQNPCQIFNKFQLTRLSLVDSYQFTK